MSFIFILGYGQSLQELEQQRLHLTNDINNSSILISENNRSNSSNINQYKLLEQEIEKSRKIYSTIKSDIKTLKSQTAPSIDTLAQRKKVRAFNRLIAAMMEQAYHKKNIAPQNNIDNHLSKAYINQFIEYKKKNLNTIGLDSSDSLLIEKSHALSLEKIKMDSLVAELKTLKQELKNQNKSSQIGHSNMAKQSKLKIALNQKIEKLIIALNNAPISESHITHRTIEDKKGFIPWPLHKGEIKLRYGEQKNPEDDKVIYINTGIDISSKHKNVFAVHEGTVINISNISSSNIAIIIRHDNDYYSVYSNLLNTSVSQGDTVSANEEIGLCNRVNKAYILHFELWHAKTNLNPYHWLKNN